MEAMPERAGILTFSTNELPERDRVPVWREVFGRSISKLDLELVSNDPLLCESSIRALPDVTIWSSLISGAVTAKRTSSHLADGDDNFVLNIIRRGRLSVTQRDREVIPDEGAAFLWSNAEKGTLRQLETSDFVSVALSRRLLEGVVRNVDNVFMRPIPASTEALRLLRTYIDVLLGASAPTSPELLALSAAHMGDLAVLAIGATRGEEEVARNGGLRAARLQAVKSDILANLTQADLNIEHVAARHRVSPRYVRDLFNADGTTFGDFVREQRLRKVYRLLCDPMERRRSIGEIALTCGFGDISHFNHSFRRRFGETPSDARERAIRNPANQSIELS
ncbi:AraC family transcriptional regulator [Mesorhizobium sp. BAC0120]|uniref:helix-turn-helix transcriptional regulator n=1 Tax=Mesorhizobium sp. BAC0120 TaxID=3090670 RepID=UPI00298CACA0|nr:AraC family transcriptional regulator [Mesorhizobium sp. BAC0120]MDW6023346.1 AraC family transcriptional regulator [Mesorhizobium sp. BAC0120]